MKNDSFWENFCNQIHIPGDKDGKMMKALLLLPNDSRYKWAFEKDETHVTDYENGYVMRVYKDCLR